MKLHKNDQNNTNIVLGYRHVLNHEKKNNRKSELKSVFLKLKANDQSNKNYL